MALAVTIAVIIILSTVLINAAFGDGGVIKQSQTIKDTTSNVITSENEDTNRVMQEYANVMAEDGEGGETEEPEEPTDQVATKIETVTKREKFQSTTKVSDETEDILYVPGGFGIASDSPNEIDEGIVITDGINEFVWIPVDTTSLNEMYTLSPETSLSGKEIGVRETTNVYSKFRDQNGYIGGMPGSLDYREPDILIDNEMYGDTSSTGISIISNIFNITGTDIEIVNKFANMLVEEYEASYVSTKKYGGFYIGRYELTGTQEEPTVRKGQNVLVKQYWYDLKKICSDIIKNSKYAQSTMIYGNQWDKVLDWIIDTGGKTSKQVYIDSSDWGNYQDSTGEAAINSGTRRVSGYNEAWKSNNIYDLAGNYYEWTQEANDTGIRVFRGGGCYQTGVSYNASYRDVDNPTGSFGDDYTSRVTMYIK